jgi:hypothetical protein
MANDPPRDGQSIALSLDDKRERWPAMGTFLDRLSSNNSRYSANRRNRYQRECQSIEETANAIFQDLPPNKKIQLAIEPEDTYSDFESDDEDWEFSGIAR